MKLTLIAAMSKNRVIGRNNDLIWHLPRDLRHFKEKTNGHHIIMGRKTFESLGKPLPNRVNIIITRDKNYNAPGCIVVNSLTDAIKKAETDPQPYIVGGAEIYRQSLNIADQIELTIIDHEFDGDAFFPEFNKSQWREVAKEEHPADEKNEYNMEFVTYRRKT